jgi:C1A family cysteine protease
MKTLLFPENSDPKNLYSLGRNGIMFTKGVEISDLVDRVRITPINTKGDSGRCFISLPADKGYLLQVSQEIARLANSLEQADHRTLAAALQGTIDEVTKRP